MLNATMSASSTPPIHRSRTAARLRCQSARCPGTAEAGAGADVRAITPHPRVSPR